MDMEYLLLCVLEDVKFKAGYLSKSNCLDDDVQTKSLCKELVSIDTNISFGDFFNTHCSLTPDIHVLKVKIFSKNKKKSGSRTLQLLTVKTPPPNSTKKRLQSAL